MNCFENVESNFFVVDVVDVFALRNNFLPFRGSNTYIRTRATTGRTDLFDHGALE